MPAIDWTKIKLHMAPGYYVSSRGEVEEVGTMNAEHLANAVMKLSKMGLEDTDKYRELYKELQVRLATIEAEKGR